MGGKFPERVVALLFAGFALASYGYQPIYEDFDDAPPHCINEIVVTNANPAVATKADRLFVELYNADALGGTVYMTLIWDGDENVKPESGDYGRVVDLPVMGCHSETFDDKHVLRPCKRLDRVVFTLDGGESRRFKVRRLAWLASGDMPATEESVKDDFR